MVLKKMATTLEENVIDLVSKSIQALDAELRDINQKARSSHTRHLGMNADS
jgi:hypothetical protein